MFALLAVAAHTIYPPAGENRTVPSGTGQNDGAKGSKKGDKGNAREGPWLATRAFFGSTGASDIPAEEKELRKKIELLVSPTFSAPASKDLQDLFGNDPAVCPGGSYSLVATVADPVHTRQALFFDGQIDSIERAAEEDGWVFAQQWLPWFDPFDGSEHDINERRAQRRLEREQESLPGILVFRANTRRAQKGRGSCLFVMLVPETPTGGVAQGSLMAALNVADLLTKPNQIGLLAPSYSGSFPSLASVVKEWSEAPLHYKRLYSTAYGGSISSRSAAYDFFDKTKLSFHSGVLSDIDFEIAIRSLPRKYDVQSIAYLVEQESGYAADATAAFEAPGEKVLVYKFPRDVSHLRNAYQRASANLNGRYQSPIPSIELSLSDPSRGEDSIPDFSETDTPVIQSAEIGTITEDLKRKGIRLVYIAATNSLDELFLAQFLRQQIPDVRVVIGGDTDLLFLPAASQRSLAGTLFLSTYPMFFEADAALATDQFSRYSLQSENLQGLFNVTQLLLWHLQGGQDPPPKALRAYGGLRSGDSSYPGLWLLELTRFGFSPVDWFPAPEANQSMEANPSPKTIPGELPQPLTSAGWYITSRLISLAILAGCFIFVKLDRTNSISWPVWVNSEGAQDDQFPLFAGSCLFISALPWLLGIPAVFQASQASPRQIVTLAFLALAYVAPLICLGWIAANREQEGKKSFCWRGDAVFLMAAALYLTVSGTWFWLCQGSEPGVSLFRWRALHLYSSSSPTLPLLLICGIFAGGLFAEFYRRSDTGDMSPHLSLEGIDGIPSFTASYSAVNRLIGGAFDIWRSFTCLFVTGPSAWLLWHFLPAFEIKPYSWILKILVIPLIWMLAGLGYDAVAVWLNLNKLLALIESMPLKGVFARVARGWPRQQVWAFWKSTPQRALAAQMSEALHNGGQAGTQSQQEAADAFFESARNYFGWDSRTPENRDKDQAVLVGEYIEAGRAYENLAAETAKQLFTKELWEAWKSSPTDDDAEKNMTLPSAKRHRYSADFVALQCCNYLTYAVRQTQRLVWSISFLLLLLIVVLNSYAPQGPLFIGRYVAVLFVVAGCIAVYVFAGMERNWILSQISRTKPGELNAEFWLHITAMGFLPLIGVLVHLFPDAATFLSSWVAPGVDSLK